ncbi:sulfatase [Polaribacter sp. Hel_I_88]|uniref:sulfatase family protein n=1 Tax=Polaribacter sp. Hel_I_88 TaxID=1250006 RepID=UPI00047C6928|nr:sulfatase [Polaribacter sp. Hel_I_88]
MKVKIHKIIFFFLLFIVVSFSAQEKPNILWITIEDTSPQFIGCYGNENASTPNIDKLAENGIRFTNAFATGTVCSASRSAIITGVPTFKLGTGNHRSNYPIPTFIKGFPYYLKQEGYYTSNNEKTDYNIANEKEFIDETWDDSSNTATWSKRKDKNQPFFSVFNFAASHQSRTMSMPFDWYEKSVLNYLSEEERIGNNDFEMPPYFKDSPEMRKQFARVYNSIKLTDKRIGDLLQKLEKDNLLENTIIFFYADHGEGIPRAKTNGINLGYRVPFIIKFPKKYKHLSPWGKEGIVTNDLISFEDLAPTIINLAKGNVPNYLKGRDILTKNNKKNYLLLSSDRADNGPDLTRTITDGRFVYSRNFTPFMPEMRYIRYIEQAEITQQMRLDLKNNQLNEVQTNIFKNRPFEVLYDIDNDIWETKNLAGDQKYKAVLKKMRNQLDADILKAKDILFATEYKIEVLSEKETPYQFRLDDKKYPFHKIYKAASLSGKKGNHIAKKQAKLLSSENEIVRYWASVGLLSQEKNILQSYKKELSDALNDSFAPVAITAAAISYDVFGDKKSEEILKKYSLDDNLNLALLTINYLIYIKDKLPFLETIKKSKNLPSRNYKVTAACTDFLVILNSNDD